MPGGDIVRWLGAEAGPEADVSGNFARFVATLAARHPEVPAALLERLAHAYGTRVVALLAAGLGAEIAPGVHEAELRHLVAAEWATRGDDILWRRSKLGLHLDAVGRDAVELWLRQHVGSNAAALATTS